MFTNNHVPAHLSTSWNFKLLFQLVCSELEQIHTWQLKLKLKIQSQNEGIEIHKVEVLSSYKSLAISDSMHIHNAQTKGTHFKPMVQPVHEGKLAALTV